LKTPAQVKKDLRARGVTITNWALQNGIHHQVVRDLLTGKLKGHRGIAHQAAIKLGIKENIADESANDKQRLAA
jgi:gp16 family phage-associated protein